jgi:hypothetical protein
MFSDSNDNVTISTQEMQAETSKGILGVSFYFSLYIDIYACIMIFDVST